ncbi:MAG TPA: hypothetical protein VFV19_06985 [Candidatus Polarisedimenticolaceae bacterium]|nr:hypothetical protein [Candidatus Polarisedimenticolaceae bacterium]
MKSTGIVIAALTLILAIGLPAQAQECVSVRIDAPFRLPDGSVRPAGRLTLCESRAFSPVTELHAVLVNGASVGMFPSRRRSNEIGTIVAPQVLFEREGEGMLALVGYVVPSAGRSLSFRLRPDDLKSVDPPAVVASAPSPAPVAAIVAVSAR